MKGLSVLLLGFLLIPAVAPRAYEGGEVEGGATVRGRVSFEGPVPRIADREVFQDQEVCGSSIRDESLMIGPGRGVRDVVVTLEGVTRGKPIEEPVLHVMEQRGCRFVPHVLAAQTGQWLLLANDDPIRHYPAAVSFAGSSPVFGHALPPAKEARHLLLEPGTMRVSCNAQHAWMDAYVVVVEHPYVAVTDASGDYELGEVPPGRYAIKVWHERLGVMERPIEVAPDGFRMENFAYRSRAKE